MPKRVAENECASRLDALEAASNYRASSEFERKVIARTQTVDFHTNNVRLYALKSHHLIEMTLVQ